MYARKRPLPLCVYSVVSFAEVAKWTFKRILKSSCSGRCVHIFLEEGHKHLREHNTQGNCCTSSIYNICRANCSTEGFQKCYFHLLPILLIFRYYEVHSVCTIEEGRGRCESKFFLPETWLYGIPRWDSGLYNVQPYPGYPFLIQSALPT